MRKLVLTELTTDEIRQMFREEMQELFSNYLFLQNEHKDDEISGVDLAVQITGKAKATIYSLVSMRKIPHSKRGGKLYFSRKELTEWIKNGKRKTETEIIKSANDFK